MRKKKRSTTLLLVGIFSFVILLFFTHTFPPSSSFSLSSLSIPATIPFFILFFGVLLGFGGFLLTSSAQGIVAGLFGILFLLLRMLGFTHWFFTLILLLLFTVVEIIFLQKS